jgi:uncharacterized protein (DUF305 family)
MRSIAARVVAVLGTLAAALCLSACTDRPAPAPDHHADQTTSADNHNADDVMFAQNMIPHHEQALELAAMVPTNTANADLFVVAKHITADQQPEIRLLTGWLQQWGEDVPGNGGHSGHGGMAIDGMVDPATMDKLKSLKGAEFDTLWVQSMIGHHQGAITMAEAEIAHGQSPDAISLAKLMVTEQRNDIATMNRLTGMTQ